MTAGPQLGDFFLLRLLKHLQQDSLSSPFLNVEMPECVALGVVDQIDYQASDYMRR